MNNLESIILLMAVAVLLVQVAQHLKIPYPISLVLGGAALGFFPGVNPVQFDPTLILTIVLPPILYYGSFWISFREFKQNFKDIFSLAIGLVIFTTFIIGLLFKWLFPEYPWALAFAFGAIVSPPDAAAATTILKRFAIGSRLSTILEGESLVNDASALVLYRLATIAILSGTFSLPQATFEFFKDVSLGIIVGLVAGIFLQFFSRRFLEPVVAVVFSFTIPYIVYILADSLGVSGVLAVVTAGLIGSRVLITHQSSLRRVLGYTSWDIFIILLNCFVFILIGTHLRVITSSMSTTQIFIYSGYGLLITFALIAIRLLWVYARNGIVYLLSNRNPKLSPHAKFILRDSAILGWSGMRGIVSLTAALGLPIVLTNGMILEGREIVIFIAFIVIMLTLLIPGLTLPSLLHFLHIHHSTKTQELRGTRDKLADVAKEEIVRLHKRGDIKDEDRLFLITYFHTRQKVLENASSSDENIKKIEAVRLNVLKVQREILLHMWEHGEIDDKILRLIGRELDIEESDPSSRAEIR